MFFQSLEKELVDGRPQSVISIDMAFLKYYDKIGGSKTGDAAIIQAAEVLESVAKYLKTKGVNADAYRVGGDEFALRIDSADEALIQEVKRRIPRACAEAGPVPASTQSDSRYTPESLQMSIGDRSATSLDQFRQEMVEAGLYPTDTVVDRRKLIDLFVHLSDKESEVQKTVNRFIFLLERKSLDSAENYQDLLNYSQKSIFGSQGTEQINIWAQELAGKDSRALREKIPQILDYVLERLRAQDAQAEQLEDFSEALIESSIRIRFFEDWARSLEGENHELKQKLTQERARIQELRAAQRSRDDDAEKRQALRTSIAGAAE
jgi:GGDEF domain-containing protein